MIHNLLGFANWALSAKCLAIGGGITLLVIWNLSDGDELRCRARQGTHLLAEAGPLFVAAVLTWACRGRSPSRAHPAAKAVSAPGWSPLSEEEAWEFGVIADLIEAGVEAPEPEYKTRRGEAS